MKVLIVHSRELCYYSGSFFLDRIQSEMERRDIEVVRADITDDDFSVLEDLAKEEYDAIVDINSRLPKLIDDDGRYFLDTIDAPFYNYIVDHPLYHYGGLSVKLKDYHAIAVDRFHCGYMEEHYPHLKSVSCIPMGGTKAITPIPFEARRHDFLFSGTYILPEVLDERMFQIRHEHGDAVYKLMRNLFDYYSPQKDRIDEALYRLLADLSGEIEMELIDEFIHDTYEARDEKELLNWLYIVDQKTRNDMRLSRLKSAALSGLNLSILGEGWEATALSEAKNVTLIPPVKMELSFEVMADSKYLIDVNPLFACGMHDRVTAAMANRCVCISDMSPAFDKSLSDGQNIFFYEDDPAQKMVSAAGMSDDAIMALTDSAYDLWEKNYSWQAHVNKLLEICKNRV